MAFLTILIQYMQQIISNRANDLDRNGYYFNSQYYLIRAWNLIKPQWLVLSLFTAVYLLITFILFKQPQIGQIIQMVISGPIGAGYYLSINRIMKGETIRLSNLLDGFKIFLQTMIVSMLSGLLVSIGFFLLVIPGIFLSVVYIFVIPLVVFGKLDFWSALESSRVIITKRFWEAFAFLILIAGVNLIGVLAFGVGLFFTIPLSYAMILMAYDDIYGIGEKENNSIDNSFSHFR